MAEAAAALGLATSIAAFVELGLKVVKRLKQFHEDVDAIPEAFRSIKYELPLTINTLERTLAQAKAGYLSLATTKALNPLVESCLDQVKYLDGRLDRLLPSKDATGWERTVKALKSVYQNKDIEESVAELHKHILLLAFHQATSAAEYGQRAAAQEQLKSTWQKPAPRKPHQKQQADEKPEALPDQVSAKFAWTPLHEAAKRGDDQQVKTLLAGGADVNAIHSSGCTPLLTASRWKHYSVVSLLLDSGACINAMDNDQISPLAGAALWGNDSIVKLLLDRGARINPRNVGQSALHGAAREGRYTTVQLLLDRGANIDVVNHHGSTPLHHAARDGRRWTSKLLLDKGANPEVKDHAGLTPLDLATKGKRENVVEVLMQHKKTTSPNTLPQPKERWERLDKSPVRIVYKEAKQEG